MGISNGIKRRLRTWLQTDDPTEQEKRLEARLRQMELQLGRVGKREEKLRAALEQTNERVRKDSEKTQLRLKELPKKIWGQLVVGEFANLKQLESQVRSLERAVQINGTLAVAAHPIGQQGRIGSPLHRHEAQIYSQNGEDGIFLYIFGQIGTTNRRFVEIGAGGLENNTNNLFFNFGWSGFWVDMDQDCMDRLATYVERNFPSLKGNYRIHVGRVTPETLDELVAGHCQGEDPDLLTIDVDSYDGQMLRALESVRPRVLGCEYNAAFGLRNAMVPFSADFSRNDYNRYYYGASLAALAKIAAAKGYALVGCDSHGVNAFFLREDCLTDSLPAKSVEEAYVPNRRYTLKSDLDEQWGFVKDFPLEEA
jgi:hypothetical protein